MKKGSTVVLRAAVVIIGLIVLALCGGIVYMLMSEGLPSLPYRFALLSIITCLFVSTIPFYMALSQAMKLLGYIGRDSAFSELSVQALKKIKYCAAFIAGIYIVCEPFFFMVAEMDDAPGLVLFGSVPVFASCVIAVFAALLQRLLSDAIAIKSENELTV